MFIETADGERFKLPFKNLLGAKVIARHVTEGGKPYDAFGNHIIEMMNQISTLGRFLGATRRKEFDESATPMIEIARSTYTDLKAKAKRMIGSKGYRRALEGFDPAELRAEEQLTDDIRGHFIEKKVDDRIEEALPLLARLAAGQLLTQENDMKEVEQFENWTTSVTEGTWAVPDTDEEIAELTALFANPIPVGTDADNATTLLYSLIGDDELFDDLYELSEQDPDSDCRDIVAARLGELGVTIEYDNGGGDGDAADASIADEDLDTDGIMMTQPSNMSSESIDSVTTLKTLSGL